MKKLILASLLLFAGFAFSTVYAQSSETPQAVQTSVASTETPVAVADLPETVHATLKSDQYAGWTVNSAMLVTKGDKTYYKLELVNGEEKKTVKLNRDGSPVM